MVDQAAGFGARTGSVAHAVSMVGSELQRVADATVAMFDDAAAAPGRLAEAGRLLTDGGANGSVASVLGAAFGALVLAVLVALAAHRLLRPARLRLRSIVPETAERMAALILRELVIDLVPPAIYLAAALALDHILFGPTGRIFVATDVFRMVTSAVAINSAVAWFIAVVLQLPVAYKRPGLRLLPLDEVQAKRARDFVRRVVGVAAGSWLLAESLFLVWLGDGVPRLILIVAAAVIGLFCLRALSRLRRRFTGFMWFWHKLAIVSVFGLFLTWALGLLLVDEPPFGRVLATLGILMAMPLLDDISVLVLRRIKHRMEGDRAPTRRIYVPKTGENDVEELRAVEQPLDDAAQAAVAAEVDRALDAFTAVLHSAFCTVLGIVAALLLAKTWSLELVDHARSSMTCGPGSAWWSTPP